MTTNELPELSPAARIQLENWVGTWWWFLANQHERVSPRLRETSADTQVDSMAFASALSAFATGAERLLGKEHAAVRAFSAAVPDARDIRDVLAHYVEYIDGQGRLQDRSWVEKNGRRLMGPLTLHAERLDDTAVIRLADRRLNVADAYLAAEKLAIAALHLGRRGPEVSAGYQGGVEIRD